MVVEARGDVALTAEYAFAFCMDLGFPFKEWLSQIWWAKSPPSGLFCYRIPENPGDLNARLKIYHRNPHTSQTKACVGHPATQEFFRSKTRHFFQESRVAGACCFDVGGGTFDLTKIFGCKLDCRGSDVLLQSV